MKKKNKMILLIAAAAAVLVAVICIFLPGNGGGNDGENLLSEKMLLGEGIELQALSGYQGPYVEDGTDDIVSDVLAITVRNDGDKTVQYAHIILTQGETAYEFDVTPLPVGASAQLLELSRQPMPDNTDGMTAQVTACAVFDTEPTMCEDVFQIETQDTAITITNNSGSDITGQIYVYYKIAYGDLYMGGITYRVGTAGLKAGESTTCYAGHFSTDYSKLMFVTYVQ